MKTLKIIGMSALVSILLGSALAVIYTSYYGRKIFMDIQQQEAVLDKYEIQWGQMRLELRMLAKQNHIEQVAVKQLKLIMPQRETTVHIQP